MFEAYLRKQKEKRKENKNKNKNKHQKGGAAAESEQEEWSEADENDPFFANAFDEAEFGVAPSAKEAGKKTSSAKKQQPKKAETAKAQPSEEEETKAEELELLLMDDAATNPLGIASTKRRHFDLDEIVQAEKDSGKKKRKRSKKNNKKDADAAEPATIQDDFEVDVKDERFNALYTSPQFAIDPTSSKFKKTRAMDKVLDERKRRNDHRRDMEMVPSSSTMEKSDSSVVAPKKDQLQSLVKKLKVQASNTTAFGRRKEKK